MNDLARLVEQGELNVEKDGQPVRDQPRLRQTLDEAATQQLTRFAHAALLEA